MTADVLTLDQVDACMTDSVIAEYWERGYWISPKIFNDEQIASLRRAHER